MPHLRNPKHNTHIYHVSIYGFIVLGYDKSALHRNAIFLLAGSSRLVQREFGRRGKAYGLNRAQWQVLATLVRCEGEKQIALAERLDIEPIVLARILDRLEQAGFIQRRADPADRRARQVFLTAEAQPLIQQMRKLGKQTGDLAFEGFTRDEIEQLSALLGRLCVNLSDKFEAGAWATQPSRTEVDE